jgi:hypothetical protein
MCGGLHNVTCHCRLVQSIIILRYSIYPLFNYTSFSYSPLSPFFLRIFSFHSVPSFSLFHQFSIFLLFYLSLFRFMSLLRLIFVRIPTSSLYPSSRALCTYIFTSFIDWLLNFHSQEHQCVLFFRGVIKTPLTTSVF